MSRGKNGASGSAENSYMIYDKGSWTKPLRGIGDPSIGQCTFRS